MIGEDGQAVDWSFVQPYLDQRVGEQKEKVRVEIAKGVVMEAKPIEEYLVGTYIKGGGPGYRMLAKMGKAPMETIKLDIASHAFVKPTDLEKRVADDICLRCHTCMIDAQDRLDDTLAHQSVRCVDCHSEGVKQCNGCHVGDLQNTVGKILEFGKKPIYYGKDKEGMVRPMIAHEIFGKDEKKYGGWIMKHTVHGIKRNAYTDCVECHTDPVRMGIGVPDLKPVNTYLIKEAGVPNAYTDKAQHAKEVKAGPKDTCVSCHTEPGSGVVARFHQTVREMGK